MRRAKASCLVLLSLWMLLPACWAENAAKPKDEPQVEPATLHSLGIYWIIEGDDNRNACVQTFVRKKGAQEWRQGLPLFRVEKGGNKLQEGLKTKLNVPRDAWLFAGSLLLLEPGTEYEVRLALKDPDGGEAEKVLAMTTAVEPALALDAPRKVLHVVPGKEGGSGTEKDPYQGLVEAQKNAEPDVIFLLHAGAYEGPFLIEKFGKPGKPIVWRAAGDGLVEIVSKGPNGELAERVISGSDIHDVWFEGLTLRNAHYGVVLHRSWNIVLRGCHIHQVEYGITFTNNTNDKVRNIFIADCVIEGPSVWPRTPEKGIENARGIQATGTGIEVCYNRIRGFADAVDTFGSPRCCAIDFHHNDIDVMTDDGIEMDYSERNTRCFYNRLTNCFQGISLQPVHGGPIYVFRNVMYNVVGEPFKLHNEPSGGLLLHNTCVKKGMPHGVYAGGAKIINTVSRNNLFIGTEATYAAEFTTTMVNCNFDYDGFGGGPYRDFLKWNEVRYKTFEELKEKTPAYRNAVIVDPATAFTSGLKPPEDEQKQMKVSGNDLRLKEGTAAIDAGEVLPGINDGFAGKAPDLGAYEFGAPVPHYGPRTGEK